MVKAVLCPSTSTAPIARSTLAFMPLCLASPVRDECIFFSKHENNVTESTNIYAWNESNVLYQLQFMKI